MTHLSHLASFDWDPSRIAFHIPVLNHPVAWYGIIFSVGFFLAYLLALYLLQQRLIYDIPNEVERKKFCTKAIDRLTWFLVAGTVIGARLGEVFFYDWPSYRDNPLEIFKIWHGGLASHGGAVGVFIALALYCYLTRRVKPPLSYLSWLDLLMIPIALVSTLIRIGNFVNQEIIGSPTQLPWAVRFLHPLDGSAAVPRHPVQLYEALVYFLTFAFLNILWRKGAWRYEGLLSGALIFIVFSARFFLEYLKLPLSHVIDETNLHMGQYLSVPFIVLGAYLCLRSQKHPLRYP